MFWERLVCICNQKETTPSAVVQALGIAIGSITKWKNGVIPRSTTLQKLADYFGVTPDYLLGKQDNPLIHTVVSDDNTTQNVELTPQEADLLEKLKQLDDDQAKQMLDYLEFLIQQRKKKE